MSRWDLQANDIFADAVEIGDIDSRREFVRLRCQGDGSLRRKVESLLECSVPEDDFLSRSIDHEELMLGTATISILSGMDIGRYKLLQKIGEGGFGVVFMAEQKEPVRRKVALKIIKAGMDTNEVIARFEAERQALAMMDHPNIARVFDAGATESGRPYFVMELVRGVPINKFCDHNRLSPKERIRLFMPVCYAIQHAHQKAIIHRDIKPSNVLVTMHDGVPVPKVIDFGIAKCTQSELTEKTIFTRFQQLLGTPSYMAPEQAQMSGLDIDTRCDIYALGVMLYELLTGVTPFSSEELMRGGLDEFCRRLREVEPPKPSSRVMTMSEEDCNSHVSSTGLSQDRLRKLLSGDLDWIVMKAMEKNRTRRYETALGLAQDIRRYLDCEPVWAAAPTMSYRLRKFFVRNRIVISIAAILVLTVSVSTALLYTQMKVTARERDRVREMAQQAELNADLAERESERARKAELRARESQYVSDIANAYHYWSQGNLLSTKQLLANHLLNTDEHDFRGLEWYFLASRLKANRGARVFGGLETKRNWDLHPNERTIATVVDGRLQLFELADRNTQQLLDYWVDDAVSTQFSPDGHYLAVATRQQTDVIELSSNTSFHLDGSIRFSPDGNWIVAILADGRTIQLWDARNRKLKWSSVSPLPILHSLGFTPNSMRFAALSRAGGSPVMLWSTKDGESLVVDIEDDSAIRTGLFTSNDRLILFGRNGASFVDIKDRIHGRVAGMVWPTESVVACDITDDRRKIALGTFEHEVRVHNAINGQIHWRAVMSHPVQRVRFLNQGNTILIESNGDVTVHGLSDSGTSELPFETRLHWAESLATCRETIAVAGPKHELILWNTDDNSIRSLNYTPKPNQSGDPQEAGPWTIRFSPDGSTIAAAGSDRTLRFWNQRNGNLIDEQPLISNATRLVYSNDGKLLACSGREVSVWDLASAVQDPFWVGAEGRGAISINFTPDNRYLITGGLADGSGWIQGRREGLLCIFSVHKERLRSVKKFSHSGFVFTTSVSPDGRWCVAGDSDGIITIYDLIEMKVHLRVAAHTGIIYGTAFSPDGKTLTSVSGEGAVLFWRVQGWQQVGKLRKETGLHAINFIAEPKLGIVFGMRGSQYESAKIQVQWIDTAEQWDWLIKDENQNDAFEL